VITRLSATSIRITNFGGFESYIDATIESQANTSKIKIDFRDPGQRSFTGEGTISGNTLTGNYVVKFSDNTTDTATFEYKK
jgi:hypothetical protein